MSKRIPKAINSMQDLQRRKQALELQINEKEQEINTEYHTLIDTLTFKNVLGSVSQELASANLVAGKAYSIGKFLLERRKKRRQLKKATVKK